MNQNLSSEAGWELGSQLILEICSYPLNSAERQKALTQLLRWLANLPLPLGTDQEACLLQWREGYPRICADLFRGDYDADPQRAIAVLRSSFQAQQLEGELSVWSTQEVQIERLYLEFLGTDGQGRSLLEAVRTWAEADPDGELAQIYLTGHPQVTCQLLILRRLPPATHWRALATEWGVTVASLSQFYQHHCLPRLRQFGQVEGHDV